MSTATTSRIANQYFLWDHISWETYERLLREAKHVRMTYDNGDLEIMTVSFGHENAGDWLGSLVRHLAYELGVPLRGGGTTTLRSKLKKKGLEADRCYWIAHERSMRGKKQWRARVDPPPDLALDIEVTRSALNRMRVYSTLGVPEVWCYDGKSLRVYCLTTEKDYRRAENSPTFPTLSLDKLVHFVKSSEVEDETALMHRFADWVRTEVKPRYDAWKQRNKKNGR